MGSCTGLLAFGSKGSKACLEVAETVLVSSLPLVRPSLSVCSCVRVSTRPLRDVFQLTLMLE
jgi:hypothetical protein